MARTSKNGQQKLQLPKLTPQETLIGYVSTLNDKQCKEAYEMLLERFSCKRARIIKFDRTGMQNINGKIRLTPREYERIIEELGELYFHRACEILDDYLTYLEERAQSEAPIRRRLNEYKKISHFYKITKGWVAERISEENNSKGISNPSIETLNFYDINTLEQAQRYIDELPSNLRFNNPEVEYLVTQFPQLIIRGN